MSSMMHNSFMNMKIHLSGVFRHYCEKEWITVRVLMRETICP